jgi:chromodomain-helicase-DNA-binding protein 4
MKGGVCMGCMEIAIQPDVVNSGRAEDKASGEDQAGNVIMSDSVQDLSIKPKPVEESITTAPQSDQALLFRCFTCKRVAHYQHLPLPPTVSSEANLDDIVEYYAKTWLCADCSSYRDGVDKILAWRPYPPNAVEPPRPLDEVPNYKSPLPREYLVKWLDRSFRRVQWVPHMWLVSTHQAKLKNFLTGGSKVELLEVVEEDKDAAVAPAPVFEIGDDSRASSGKSGTATPLSPLEPNPDAERRIPSAWKIVDRVLDVQLWYPDHKSKPKASTRKGKRKVNVVESDDDAGEVDESIESEHTLAFERGEQPNVDLMESVSDWETRTGEAFSLENISQVVWAFIKWNELGYDEGRHQCLSCTRIDLH